MHGQGHRGHWGVENKLHWRIGMTFREDESRLRKEWADAIAQLRKLGYGRA